MKDVRQKIFKVFTFGILLVVGGGILILFNIILAILLLLSRIAEKLEDGLDIFADKFSSSKKDIKEIFNNSIQKIKKIKDEHERKIK